MSEEHMHVGGFLVSVKYCKHVAGIKIEEVESAEFDTSHDQISVNYTGQREVLTAVMPQHGMALELLFGDGGLAAFDHEVCGRHSTRQLYVPSLETLRAALEFDILPMMIPDHIEIDNPEVQDILHALREDIGSTAKDITKSVRAELAKLRVLDEVD